jgi:DNA-directed RNA polymerase specialized sigma24 family protein
MDSSRAAHERADAELIRLARRDAAAFRVLYDRHASTMLQWLYAQVPDRMTAFELLAETWAAAWLGAARFREKDNRAAAAWLYGIARRQVRQYRRHQWVETRARNRLQMRSVSTNDGELDEVPRRLDAANLGPGVREAFQELTIEQQMAIGYYVSDLH